MRYLAHAAVISLFFDAYLSFEILGGGGERISQGWSAGEHIKKDSLTFRLKVADVLLFGIIVGSLIQNKSRKIRSRIKSFTVQAGLFALYSVGLLALQYGEVTFTQISVALLYLTKFLSVGFYYIFFAKYFSLGGERLILRSLIMSSGAASILGIISSSLGLNYFISNRIEFYGAILIVDLFIFAMLLQAGNRTRKVAAVSWPVAAVILILGVASIILCGKRGPLLALSAGAAFLTIRSMKLRDNKRKLIAIAAMSVVGTFFVTELVSRTLVGSSSVSEGLDPRYVQSLQANDWAAGLAGFDRSTSERIGKLTLSLELIANHPLGIGFWSSIFRYDYLPDSILQFVLENGLIIAFLLMLKVIAFWLALARKWPDDVSLVASSLRANLVALSLLALTVNVLYMFKIMAVLLIMIALFHGSSSRKLDQAI